MSNSSLSLEIVDKIGSGGMGVIYLAYLVGAGGFKKKVIAKKVKKDEHRAKLLTEARLHAGLSHPNISQIIDIRTVYDEDYIISEFVEGENLKSLLDRHRQSHEKLSTETINSIFWQLVNAIKYLHSKSIIHGDLTPSNIMISSDYHVKVIDFGLSIETLDYEKTIYTENVVGTIDYLSPERIDKQKASKSSDVFALGIILLEMMTLVNPFKADSQFKTLESIKYFDPIQSINLRDEANLRIASQLLEKDPNKRIKIDQVTSNVKAVVSKSRFNKMVRPAIAVVIIIFVCAIVLTKVLNRSVQSEFSNLIVIRNSIPVKDLITAKYESRSSTQCHIFYRKLQSFFDILFFDNAQVDYVDKMYNGNFQNAVLGIVRFIENNRESIAQQFKMCDSDSTNIKMAKLFNANLTTLDFLIKSKTSSVAQMHESGFTKELLASSRSAVLGLSPDENFNSKFNFSTEFTKSYKKDYSLIPNVVLVRYENKYKIDSLDDCRTLGTSYWLEDRVLSIYKNNSISKNYHVIIAPDIAKINYQSNAVYVDVQSNSEKVCEYKVDNLTEIVSIY
jgi:serine/threonine-protein kinase